MRSVGPSSTAAGSCGLGFGLETAALPFEFEPIRVIGPSSNFYRTCCCCCRLGWRRCRFLFGIVAAPMRPESLERAGPPCAGRILSWVHHERDLATYSFERLDASQSYLGAHTVPKRAGLETTNSGGSRQPEPVPSSTPVRTVTRKCCNSVARVHCYQTSSWKAEVGAGSRISFRALRYSA
jgi:hypothetical protein